MSRNERKKAAEPTRFVAEPSYGLSHEQVESRISEGLVNKESKKVEKTYFQMLLTNTFTVFNIVLFAIAAVFVFFIIYLKNTGYGEVVDREFGISKFGFLIPAVINSFIGTYQEIHSKRTLNKLKLLNQAKSVVMRDGEKTQIPCTEVVLDDILRLTAGEQCPADAIILEGEVHVDEGILTGESDAVTKKKGDTIYGGSSILVGGCFARVEKAGDDTFSAKLSSKVRELPRHKSELMSNINRIIKLLSFALLGVVAVVIATLCIKIHLHNGDPAVFNTLEQLSLSSPATWSRIILTAGTYAIGMIPEGLVLLTSVALAVSIIKLAKEKTLIQELYSLENLSRVDTICLDKTGTLTDGSMKVIDAKFYAEEETALQKLRDLLGAFEDSNPTSAALIEAYGSAKSAQISTKIPFSSAKKHSGIVYEDGTKILLGAPDYLLGDNKEAKDFVAEKSKSGKRVLALVENGSPIALFVLEDQIRQSAASTLAFFHENHVDVKIISGDNLFTVSKIAETVGVKNADKGISLEGVSLEEIDALAEEYTIFARVSPEQKLAIVEALQRKGRKVAMTGDGVNDILALRKADASITFAKATDAAKSCSDVVLLDNDFSHLKEVVGQGRRVVNNIERSATLFLMKTFTIIGLAFLTIPFPKGQMWYSVENIYLLQTAVIGIGGFFLSLESQKEPIRGSFLSNVLTRSVASGTLILLSALLPICLNQFPLMWGGDSFISADNAKSMISILTALAGIVVALNMCIPFTRYRLIVMGIILLAALLLAFGLPTSYVGGKATTFSMFRSPDGNFFHAPVFDVAFQPWKSEVFIALNSEAKCYFVMGGFFLVAFPLYSFTMKLIAKRKNAKSLQKPN